MSAPKRIQRKRTKGWRMPEGAVYVGRPSKWGNPFRVGAPSAYWMGPGAASPFRPNPVPLMDAAHVRDIYRNMVETNSGAFERGEVRELRGRDLACWCPLDQPCHADVLLQLANPSDDSTTWCEECKAIEPVSEEYEEQIGYEEQAREVVVTRLDCGHEIVRPRRRTP